MGAYNIALGQMHFLDAMLLKYHNWYKMVFDDRYMTIQNEVYADWAQYDADTKEEWPAMLNSRRKPFQIVLFISTAGVLLFPNKSPTV